MFGDGQHSHKFNFQNDGKRSFPVRNRTRCSAPPLPLRNARTVIGHSMSKGIKKMSKIFTGCCLLLPLIILIKL